MPDDTDVTEPPAEVADHGSKSATWRYWTTCSVAAVALLALAFGIYTGIRGRSQAEATLAAQTLEDAVLPGNMMAYTNAPIYARTSGYLKRWYFDIGARVKQGELLAEIETHLSYEIDVWGSIRRSVAAARGEAQATAADLATIDLSLHAELAIDYIELRSADAQERLLTDTVKAYTRALALTQSRLAGGEAPASDVAQAQTQLDTARVQATDIGVLRAQYEHAIAILLGKPPAEFSLPPAPLTLTPPAIPVGLPSELLERRPDRAAAERRMAEANEHIGIAKAAYFPSFNLGALTGFEGNTFASWFGWPSLFWAVGLTVSQTVFDGGLRRAQSASARATYDESVANYRQTTLTSFQQVEDNLSALRILADEARQEREAVQAAENSLRIFTNRYVRGEDAYLQVVTAQTFLLANQRNDVDVRRRRMEASVLLVKALGGGWDTTNLPALRGGCPFDYIGPKTCSAIAG